MSETDEGERGLLSAEERATLLRLARASLEQSIAGRDSLDRMLGELRPSPALALERGAFVSLHRIGGRIGAGPGELRGCIGHMEGMRPLYREVIDLARSSALSDPRFSPVKAGELPSLSIEISALTPRSSLPRPGDFRPGVDGIEIELAGRRAVFLPQVATEQGWDTETTLEHLCRKAGLPAGSWKQADARLSVFQAEVFGEGEEAMPPPGGDLGGA